jgi:N-acetylglucosamine-6-sulfatase
MAPKFQMKNVDGLLPGLISNSHYGCGWNNTSHPAAYGCWQSPPGSYSTAIIGNASVAWIRRVVLEDPSRPFMAYIAPKAAHDPFNPAPWYEAHWESAWPKHEPRGGNWNCSVASRANHAGVAATGGMLSLAAGEVITDVFKNRWRTLMSVDDLITEVIASIITIYGHHS